MTMDTTELSSFFDEVELDAHRFALYADGAHASFSARERFDTLVREYQEKAQQGQGDPLRAALGLLILGKFGDALEWFGRSPGGKARHYYAAEAALGLNRFADAVHEFQQAARAGWDALECDMRVAAVHVRTGDLSKAEELLARREAEGVNRPDWHFVRGVIAEARDDRAMAGEAYEMALGLDPEHTQALFRCARLYDQCGDDEQALELYNRLRGGAVRGARGVRRGAVLFAARAEGVSEPPPGALVFQERRELPADGDRGRGHRADRRPDAAAGHAAVRVRVVGAGPQLPEEDEHPHAGRPGAAQRGRVAGVQELRRDVPERDQRPAG